MTVFLISYRHPDRKEWSRYLAQHVDWLHARVEEGALLASHLWRVE